MEIDNFKIKTVSFGYKSKNEAEEVVSVYYESVALAVTVSLLLILSILFFDHFQRFYSLKYYKL